MIVPDFLNRIIEIARRGAPTAFPNPLVGSMIEYNGRIIGEGWHQAYGKAHAEVNAVTSVRDLALLPHSTLYVTLEPCNHQGKTPPCVDLILKHGIPRVVIGVRDPFPEVDGKGIERLRARGVEVSMAPDPSPFQELIRFFRTNVLKGRPYITLKFASSADGFIAARNSHGHPVRTQISGEYSGIYTHGLRATHQAIMIGAGTFTTDHPSLSTRFYPGPSPIRILMAGNALLSGLQAWAENGAQTLVVGSANPDLTPPHRFLPWVHSIKNILQRIWEEEKIGSILVEGGAALLHSFLEENCWDELIVITSPISLGSGVPAPKIDSRHLRQTRMLGPDRLEIYRHPEHV